MRDFWAAHWAGFGHFPNANKTHLIVKDQFVEKAKLLFAKTSANISTQGKRHLGAAIGSRSFVDEYVGKVSKWVCEIRQLAKTANTQPHAAYAYAAFTHVLSSRWTCLS